MKVRTLLLVAAGLAVGYKLAKRSTEDAPYIVKGPQSERAGAAPSNPALRVISGRAQRLADQATVRGLDAIRSARRALQSRLGEYDDDRDAAWN